MSADVLAWGGILERRWGGLVVVVRKCSKMNDYHSKPYQERGAVLAPGVATPRHRCIRSIDADPRRRMLKVPSIHCFW